MYSVHSLNESFHFDGASEYLFVFEAPIDMLAYISMHKNGWENHSYVALCSTADRAALQMLKDNPHLKTVYLSVIVMTWTFSKILEYASKICVKAQISSQR